MTTVFLSGSRALGRLNDQIRQRVRRITDQTFEIILGDANGADKAFQTYLHSLHYPHVTVYCAGGKCRNNVGAWPTRAVAVPPKLRGRAFYTCKDKAMAEDADYGFVLWDRKSAGSIENVVELLKRRKKALVYFSPKVAFVSVSNASELNALLAQCADDDIEDIENKIGLKQAMQSLEGHSQTELTFEHAE